MSFKKRAIKKGKIMPSEYYPNEESKEPDTYKGWNREGNEKFFEQKIEEKNDEMEALKKRLMDLHRPSKSEEEKANVVPIGALQLRDGKLVLAANDGKVYSIESVEEIKKMITKIMLKRQPQNNDGVAQMSGNFQSPPYPNKMGRKKIGV